jgi:hypothetical protein
MTQTNTMEGERMTTQTTYTDAYIEHGSAYFTALNADDQWQRELDFQNIDRYSDAARGVVGSGSMLRLLYEKKLRADEELRAATAALRANGTQAENQAVSELYSAE